MDQDQTVPFPKPCNTLLLFLSLLTIITISEASSPCLSQPTDPLLNFLDRVQETALRTFGKPNFDPKLYVDLSLKYNLTDSELGFDQLVRSANGSVSVKDLRKFIENYFEGAGEDLVYAKPEDFVPEPKGFLPKVKNEEVRTWALKVHSLWKNLSRKVSNEVQKRPELHTLIPLPDPVTIPGSRFREVYYWDSYWVVRFVLFYLLYIIYVCKVNFRVF